ncbi:hypothetical protein SAMN05444171_1178 [Bradyrhizobium lablabi]|uniref:Uncharacterized protein n=2 Tax=Bradyrhizobium TaxID=374 RepID=A0ABY0Q734_9BRAD|nr:hypothetical protein SAMN05444163_5981 [Bradyrhizobium ottawaense]SEC33791.1 hypothetical protein SAMN05444171_1178 [Bradyrhizobium lablabi]
MTDPDPIELAVQEIQRTAPRTKPAGSNPFAAKPAADVASST